MFRNNTLALILVTSFVLVGSAGPGLAAKKYTVTQRQDALLKEIQADYKANQLTLEEKNDLVAQRQKIVDRENSMKQKNGNKLSYEDDRKLEKDLNSLSEKLQKKVLAKRVAK